MKIRFLNPVELMVDGGARTYGAWENKHYRRGRTIEVRSVVPDRPGGIARVVLANGDKTAICLEDFEEVQDGQ